MDSRGLGRDGAAGVFGVSRWPIHQARRPVHRPRGVEHGRGRGRLGNDAGGLARVVSCDATRVVGYMCEFDASAGAAGLLAQKALVDRRAGRIERYYVDVGVGPDGLGTELRSLVRNAAEGLFDAVVVDAIFRFARDPDTALAIAVELLEIGVGVHEARRPPPLGTLTPAGRARDAGDR